MSGTTGGGGLPPVEEVLLFFAQPAAQVIEETAAFFAARGVPATHRSPYSVAFAHGQVAAVPVQLRPEWCRVWVTTTPGSPGHAAASAFVEAHRLSSRRTAAAVSELERDIYAESHWPVLEAQLRASLSRQGVADVDARIAAFKQRWEAVGRKAAATPPEETGPG